MKIYKVEAFIDNEELAKSFKNLLSNELVKDNLEKVYNGKVLKVGLIELDTLNGIEGN